MTRVAPPGPPGITHGVLLRTLEVGGARLTQTTHAPNAALTRHAHEHSALTFVVAGAFTETFGQQTLQCERLAILVKPAGADHTNCYGRGGARSFIIELLPAELEANPRSLVLAEGPPRLAPATLVPCALRLYGAFQAAQRGSQPDVLIPDLEEFVARAGRMVRERSGDGDTRRPPQWLARAIERLQASCEEPHSLSTLARDSGVHPVYFARVFRRWTGASVGEYLHRRRVERAVLALGTGRAGVAALAQTLGFSDQSHFTRAFRTATGATPAAFRRAAAGGRFGSF